MRNSAKNDSDILASVQVKVWAQPVHPRCPDILQGSGVRELASGMRQLAGTITGYQMSHAAPLAGLISGRAKYNLLLFGSMHMRLRASLFARFFVAVSLAACFATQAFGFTDEATKQAATDDRELQLEKLNTELIESLTKQLKQKEKIDPAAADAVNQYSARGDVLMFLGEFEKAEADYQTMVRMKPDLDASHWRLGIAMFFANHPKQAAAQFDKYNTFDNIDRENGIWRYLSHYRAFGKDEAQRQLLRYETDDRPPFKEVYRLFDGSMTAEEVLKAIPDDPGAASRDSRLFYSHLYIGMNQVVEGKTDDAKISLETATLNTWPRKAGYGPDYMWHIGRLQYLELQKVKMAP